MSCGRKHTRNERLVDEHIHCSCGYSFYVFYNQGMLVVMPSDEIIRQTTIKAFQRFVVSTGRCQDVAVEPVDYTSFLQRADPLGLMEVGLERYQSETIGKSTKSKRMVCLIVAGHCVRTWPGIVPLPAG